jgi:hypothetical protein
MSNAIKPTLDKTLNLTITKESLNNLIKFVIYFELRDDHAIVLNSPLLAQKDLTWSPQDTTTLLGFFNTNTIDIKEIINTIPSINKEWRVTSDPFNLFCIYLSHKLTLSKLPNAKKAINALLNVFQYKLFGSVISNSFPFKAKENVMRYTIENLSKRFSIVEFETWKNVIQDRTNRILSSNGIHSTTLRRFDVDSEILYAISDIQTQVRNQIVLIARAYYENNKMGELIDSYSMFTNSDGERIMKELPGVYDLIKYTLYSELSNRVVFINNTYLDISFTLTKIVNKKTIANFLEFIVSLANAQKKTKSLEKIIHKRGFDYFVGVGGLCFNIAKTVFTSCFDNKVNIHSKLAILNHAKAIFSSSRSSNSYVINIKKSLIELVLKSKITKRSMTSSGISLSFVLYIVLKSFESIRR